jgi:hydroxyethylthiazole kinase-like uncharacterized protein yjeF
MRAASQVLTVAQMRAAEQELIGRGETVSSLMARAGAGAADWVWRAAGGRPVTVLCGPGNNGGDGYVIARELARRDAAVTVVAPDEPATEAARAARASWGGIVTNSGNGGVLVDCLFGSGLGRPLAPSTLALLTTEAAGHDFLIAVDLPSGIDADSGRLLNDALPNYDLTLALGAFKPAHALMPALPAMGEVRLVPIGIDPLAGAAQLLPVPALRPPSRDAHKYSRGLVLVVEGPMAGAALLACQGAMRAGAGAVRLWTERLHPALPPDVVLPAKPLERLLEDERTGAVIAGPGLGLDEGARARLASVLRAGLPCVIDADALRLVDRGGLEAFSAPLILTPHEGEMDSLGETFGLTNIASKPQRASELARAIGGVVVFKGPDTVIAAPDGRLVYAPSSTSWLSVGGSGDVLAGIAGARLAATRDPFRAACEAVWLHSEAGRLAGPAFLASDIALAVPAAVAACLPRSLRS